jgi:hypothetical protein
MWAASRRSLPAETRVIIGAGVLILGAGVLFDALWLQILGGMELLLGYLDWGTRRFAAAILSCPPTGAAESN